MDTSINETDVTTEWPVQGLVHTSSYSQHGLETGGKIKPTDPKEWGQQTASKQMGNCSCRQLFPVWNLGTEVRAGVSNKVGSYGEQYQQFPTWNWGLNQQTLRNAATDQTKGEDLGSG